VHAPPRFRPFQVEWAAMHPQLQNLYKELKRLVRIADYEGQQVRRLASQLRGELPKDLGHVSSEDEQQIKSLVLLSEIWDYYGMFDVAKELSAPAIRLVSLQPPPQKQPIKLMQSKIRLMVAYARTLYRAQERTDVIDVLLRCREYVQTYLVKRSFPCYGTLGEIAYTLGRAYRQRQQFTDALHEFTEAIKFYEKRAVHKRKTGATNADEAEAFSGHKVATILALGVSWCHYTQGALKSALYAELVPAVIILRPSKDVLNRAYAEVIRGSIVRALTGNTTDLAEAREDVKDARLVFVEHGHQHYAAGAALELALLALAEDNIGEARKHLTQLKEAGLEGSRWKYGAMIVESRILRREAKNAHAYDIADQAYGLAKARRDVLGQIDALVARSESNDSPRAAIADLTTALDLNGSVGGESWGFNPKVHAICHLHLVRHYVELKNISDALASFGEWDRVRDRVEHQSIHQLAGEVAALLDKSERLEFRASDGLNYKVHSRRLREFLLRQARMKHHTQEDIRSALHISRGTLNKWMREFGRAAKT
jgi:hypothetical protein